MGRRPSSSQGRQSARAGGPGPPAAAEPSSKTGEHIAEPGAASAPTPEELDQRPTALELLRQLGPGDPLRLGAAVRGRLGLRAFLLDPERVTAKALAHAAFELARDRVRAASPARIADWVDQAIADELEEDLEEERQKLPWTRKAGELQRVLTERLGIEPGLTRSVCVVFNGLPTRVRRVFFGAVVQRLSLEELAAAGHGDPATVRRRLKTALMSISLLRPFECLPEDGSAADD